MKTMKQLSRMLRICRNPRYMLLALTGLLMTSCIDTVVLPIEKTIEEDFWKSKDDVEGMVSGAYKQMTNADVMRRLFVWGELRGDNLNPNSSLQSSGALSALNAVNTLNLDDKSTYADWSSLYSVINKCNLVLEMAPDVMMIDPQYTRGLYQTDRSQMLALRALAYFYLVKAFRDVPYVGTAYRTSSQEMEIKQLSPDSLLTLCIKDLEEAEPIALSTAGYTDWRKCGLINRDGVRAILADVYLWRASINSSNTALAARNRSDYQRCADLCDQVVKGKALRIQTAMSSEEKMKDLYSEELGLIRGSKLFGQVFGAGNSIESIFELQFNGSYAVNTAVCELLWQYVEKKTPGYTVAAQAMADNVPDDKNPVSSEHAFFSKNDYRYWSSCFNADNPTAESFDVRKMVATSTAEMLKLEKQTATGRLNDSDYKRYAQNWIFYRTSDVMLMQAEALVQLADANGTLTNDANLQQAASIVKEISNRSLNTLDDSIQIWRDFSTRDLMETLVLSERRRELCFEGKRWFDLMRYAYRHMTDVDATKIMGDQHQTITAADGVTLLSDATKFPKVPDAVLTILKAKYQDGGAALAFQLSTEPKFYMPILESELKVNAYLKQNPGYRTTGGEYQKNY